MSVRALVKSAQREVLNAGDLLPERAAELLVTLASIFGNVLDEIRAADMAYAKVLLKCLSEEERANRARIKAEISPEYQRKQEARDTKELVVELSRSLKYFLRAKEEERQLSRHQP